MKIDRRKFIASAAALSLGPATMRDAAHATGPALPAIGLGSWITFNVGNDPAGIKRSTAVIAAFVEAGGGMIDSSPMYGTAQSTIGKALENLGHPGNIYHADKVWIASTDQGPGQISTSTQNWNIDKFDLLQVHNLKNWQGHLETLFEMKADGFLTHVGVTTSHGRRHDLLEKVMSDQPIDFVQLTYNPVDRNAENRLLPLAIERGISVIVNRPFQRGALTHHLRSHPLPNFARQFGTISWAQLILSFIISHPAVTVTIPATTQVKHVKENKAVEQLHRLPSSVRKDVVSAIRDT